MNKLSLLIAGRYLLGARTEKNISVMVIICFLGIFIGSFALVLVASIMNGFEKVTHAKLQGVHAQVIMRSEGNELDAHKILLIITNEFPLIEAASPSATKQIILQKPGTNDMSNAVILKVINPRDEQKTSTLAHTVVTSENSKKDLSALLNDAHIILGTKLARTLGIKVGDGINILFVDHEKISGKRITLEKKEAIVSGLFSTGIEEFDAGLAVGSFELAQKLFGHIGVDQINIKLAPHADEQAIQTALQKRFGLEVFSWKDLYPALVAALKLEKYAMVFILALIALVASMNIISLVFMQIIQKRPDIAIYKAMGMHTNTIISLFMGMGIALAVCACMAGLLAGFLAGFLLQTYPFIRLPDTYYVSHLPIAMEWYIFAFVLLLVLIMSSIATWIPCRAIKTIIPAQVLRFEG